MPHNLKLRQEIQRERGKRRARISVETNPVDEYVQAQTGASKKDSQGGIRTVASDAHPVICTDGTDADRTSATASAASSGRNAAPGTTPTVLRKWTRSRNRISRRVLANSLSVLVRYFNVVVREEASCRFMYRAQSILRRTRW